MKFARCFAQEVGRVLVDALTASLITAVGVEGTSAFNNSYFDAGLRHLPQLAVADTLTSLVVAALALRAGLSVAVFAGPWCLRQSLREGYARLSALLGFGVLGACFAWVFRDQLLALVMVPFVVDQYVNLIARGKIALSLLALTSIVLCGLRSLGRPSNTRRELIYSIVALLVVGLSVAGAYRLRTFLNNESQERKNVLLVVLDTVAAGHLGSYGYARNTTPELDQLAKRGVLYTHAYAVAPWTLPSHISMFTGLYPIQHHATQEHLHADDQLNTLAEILRAEGYRTFAAINNPVIGIGVNSDQGFADFYPMWRRAVANAYAEAQKHPTNTVVERFLDGLGADDRFFVFLNYIEAHGPYEPPPEEAARFLPPGTNMEDALAIDQSWQKFYLGTNPLSEREFRVLSGLYDTQLSRLSRTVGDLIRGLEARGLLDDTLVIITSDHGENIGDHDHFDHVFNLHETLLHVPLIILDPDAVAGRKEDALATSVDLFFTALAAARSHYTVEGSSGRDILNLPDTLIPSEPSQGEALVHVAEYYYPEQVVSVFGDLLDGDGIEKIRPYLRRIRSVQTADWKLVWGSDGNHRLFDLHGDAKENHDLAPDEPEQVARLIRLLEKQLGELQGKPFRLDDEPPYIGDTTPGTERGFQGLDAEARERLKALGYVE